LDGSGDTADDVGHGTAVAGVIAARANNRLGSSGYCARCSVMPVKVVDATGRGSSSALAAGIEWAAMHGASIINVSLVLAARDPAVSAVVADALARGVLVVASAGNDGGTAPNYPAAEPGVISVAATDASAGLYPWSARGDWVSVSGPGLQRGDEPRRRLRRVLRHLVGECRRQWTARALGLERPRVGAARGTPRDGGTRWPSAERRGATVDPGPVPVEHALLNRNKRGAVSGPLVRSMATRAT
jgi:Subtilase family